MNKNIMQFDPVVSATMVREKLKDRNKLSLEIVSELHRAREFYSNSGFRSDLVTDVTRLNTFEKYLECIGIIRMTAHRWLERYLPEENKLLSYNELQDRKRIEQQKKQPEKIIAPDYDEDAFRERLKKEVENNEKQTSTKRVTEEEINRVLDDIGAAKKLIDEQITEETRKAQARKNLRISSNDETRDQEIWFESFRDYIYSIDNVNRRLEIIQNFLKYLRGLGTECQRDLANNKEAV